MHEATEDHMNFNTKNFKYVTKSFGDFVEEVGKGSKQYLRSLAANKPAETPANIFVDFPELSPDFCLPPQLESVARKAHSLPLRISGRVVMWLHYDVSCQTTGLDYFPELTLLSRLWPTCSVRYTARKDSFFIRHVMSCILASLPVHRAPVPTSLRRTRTCNHLWCTHTLRRRRFGQEMCYSSRRCGCTPLLRWRMSASRSMSSSGTSTLATRPEGTFMATGICRRTRRGGRRSRG